MYTAVPFALRIPVDKNQLTFDTTTSQYKVGQIEISQVNGLPAALAASNSSQAASATSSGYLSQLDWLKFDAK